MELCAAAHQRQRHDLHILIRHILATGEKVRLEVAGASAIYPEITKPEVAKSLGDVALSTFFAK